MEEKIIQILVQGGMPAIALVSLWITYKLASNHIEHSTDAANRLEVAITKLTQYLIDREK